MNHFCTPHNAQLFQNTSKTKLDDNGQPKVYWGHMADGKMCFGDKTNGHTPTQAPVTTSTPSLPTMSTSVDDRERRIQRQHSQEMALIDFANKGISSYTDEQLVGRINFFVQDLEI